MKTYTIGTVLLVLLSVILLLSSCTKPDDSSAQDTTVPNEKTTLTYRVCHSGGGRIEGWNSQHGFPGEQARQPVTAVPKFGYLFTGWSDRNPQPTRHDFFSAEDRTLTANFSADRKNLPIVSIETATGKDVTSKEDYIGATVSICNTGNTAWELSGAAAKIRGRGNGTWTYNKKSYRLHFEHKQNLLGLGAAEDRTWILMANHADRSMLRNYLAVDLINRIPGMTFNNSARHVEVYLNGQYHGVYLLAEQIQVDAHRVDIGLDALSDPETEDAGFLVEMDEYATEEQHHFFVEGKAYLIKNDIRNDAQFDYIKNYITKVDSAVRAGDREALETLVDLDSFVNGYIVEEFFKNLDAGWSSFYMHKKPGEKMVIGPLWDFDLGMGNNISLDNGAPEGIYVGRELGFDQRHVWYTQITNYEWFRELAAEHFFELLPYIDETIAHAKTFLDMPTDAFDRNYEVWPMSERFWHFTEEIFSLTTWHAHAEHLCNWLQVRRDWLNEYFRRDDALIFS